jgi:hypothetical protein
MPVPVIKHKICQQEDLFIGSEIIPFVSLLKKYIEKHIQNS